MSELTDEEVFGSAKELSDDDVFGKPEPRPQEYGYDQLFSMMHGEPLPPEAKTQYNADPNDLISERLPGAGILDAMRSGLRDGWGTEPLGLSDKTVKQLQDLGIYPDYKSRWADPIKAFVSTPLRALAYGGDAVARSIRSTYYAVAGGVGATAEATGLADQGGARRLTRDIVGFAESALTVAGAAPFKPGPTIGQLKARGARESFDDVRPFAPQRPMEFNAGNRPIAFEPKMAMPEPAQAMQAAALGEEGALGAFARAQSPEATAVAARSTVAEPAVTPPFQRSGVPFDRDGVAIQTFDPQAPIALPSGTFWRPPKINPLTGQMVAVRQRAGSVADDATPAARAAAATPEPAPATTAAAAPEAPLRPGVDFENVPMRQAAAPEAGVTREMAVRNSDSGMTTAVMPDDPATMTRAPLVDKAGNINLNYYTGETDFKRIIRETADDPNFQESLASQGPVRWTQVDELADAYGLDPKAVAESVAKEGMQAKHVDAWRKILKQTSDDMANLEAAIARGAVDDATLIAYQEARLSQYAAQKAVSDAATQAGRNLNIFKKVIGDAKKAGADAVATAVEIMGC